MLKKAIYLVGIVAIIGVMSFGVSCAPSAAGQAVEAVQEAEGAVVKATTVEEVEKAIGETEKAVTEEGAKPVKIGVIQITPCIYHQNNQLGAY